MGLWLKPGTLVPYTPKAEREKPEHERTVFQLAVLSAADYAAVQDAAITDYGTEVKRGTHIITLLRLGVRGWSGPGSPPFALGPDGRASEGSIDALTGRLRIELADALDRINTVGDTEGKASE